MTTKPLRQAASHDYSLAHWLTPIFLEKDRKTNCWNQFRTAEKKNRNVAERSRSRKDTFLAGIAIPGRVTDSYRHLGQIIYSPCLSFPKFPSLLQSRRFFKMASQYFFLIFTRTEELSCSCYLYSPSIPEIPCSSPGIPPCCMSHSPFSPLDQGLSIAPVQLDTLFFHVLVASHAPLLPIQMGKINRILTPGDHRWTYIRCAISQITPPGYIISKANEKYWHLRSGAGSHRKQFEKATMTLLPEFPCQALALQFSQRLTRKR